MAMKKTYKKTTTVTTSSDQASEQAYTHTNKMTRDLGTTRDFSSVRVQSNARPLEAFVQDGQRVTKREWDSTKGEYGEYVEVKKDIVEKAQSHMGTLKLKHPATSGIRQRRQQEECKRETGRDASRHGGDVPCGLGWGSRHSQSPVPTVPLSGGMKKKRVY